jgi:hypothetical protein
MDRSCVCVEFFLFSMQRFPSGGTPTTPITFFLDASTYVSQIPPKKTYVAQTFLSSFFFREGHHG